ncbi:MAG: ThuA domain-containing protein, partial [Gaiella sp.]
MARVLVWNEHVHERRPGRPAELYPDGIHVAIAGALREVPGLEVATATLADPELGLDAAALAATDVLVWWGHLAHDAVPDEVAERVRRRVLEGMGLVVLHSAHHAKPFRLLMGTSCNLRWREGDDRELVWVVDPGHPIAEGLPAVIPLEAHEMYGELFDIPAPDELVLISSFSGGEVFRSGCCFRRGRGRIFYFGPGHETYPV